MLKFATQFTLWLLLSLATPAMADDRVIYDITLHKPEEIRALLERIEKTSKAPRPKQSHPPIALVLHGPEVDIFTIKNYPRYQDIVDKAARLDALGQIEVKMCRTKMGEHNLTEQDIPAFIETVPFGPDEAARLEEKGYQRFRF
ncbi:MAG: DsrE family protein [Gammaproteobacteria bacterium]|nr:DsrE family protein [Gammaproteobacteria bacterium]MDH5594710.1 DsrE family protein [Gammaproteobacteria bacterium]